MSKNKTINRLISKIVLAGLLLGTLPVGLPLSGQPQRVGEFKKLKVEVEHEVTQIKKTVDRLKAAKIAVPIILAVAGIALTALAAAVVAAVASGLVFRSEVFQVMKILKGPIKGCPEKFPNMLTILSALSFNLKSSPKALTAVRIQLAKDQGLVSWFRFSPIWKEASAEKRLKLIKQLKKEIRKNIITVLKPELRKIKLVAVSGASISAIAIALLGIIGTVTPSIGLFFGLSALSVSAAFKGAKKIERIKRKYPGILTVKQERILAQLKDLSKDITTQAIIKELRLEDAQMAAVNKVMRQHHGLVEKLGGQKKARKIFTRYIKFKYQEEFFEKALAADAKFIKSFVSIKKKIAKLEKNHPGLETALKKAVQAYTTQADAILEELKEDIVKAAEKEEAKKTHMVPQPVVPL